MKLVGASKSLLCSIIMALSHLDDILRLCECIASVKLQLARILVWCESDGGSERLDCNRLRSNLAIL